MKKRQTSVLHDQRWCSRLIACWQLFYLRSWIASWQEQSLEMWTLRRIVGGTGWWGGDQICGSISRSLWCSEEQNIWQCRNAHEVECNGVRTICRWRDGNHPMPASDPHSECLLEPPVALTLPKNINGPWDLGLLTMQRLDQLFESISIMHLSSWVSCVLEDSHGCRVRWEGQWSERGMQNIKVSDKVRGRRKGGGMNNARHWF